MVFIKTYTKLQEKLDVKIQSQNLFNTGEVTKILSYVEQWQNTNIEVRLGSSYSKKGGVMKSFKIIWNKDNQWIQDKIVDWVNSIPGVVIIDKNSTIECTFRRYEVGDFFIKHDDHVYSGDKRIYTVGIQLSDLENFSGGDLKFYLPDKEYTMPYNKGKAYIFDSGIPHSVEVVTRGIRETLMLFIGESNIKRDVKNFI
jgi:Rps23 Pro-64 3,4-dihydroxylase Tpa1-like proline 4-hydroxylase